MNDPKLKTKIYAITTFIWFLITFFSAIFFSHLSMPDFLKPVLSYSFHPQWTTVTLGPIVFLQFLWVKSLKGEDALIRDASSRRYLIMFLFVAGLLTGIATNMGFLPLFFHQVCVWPLSIYMVLDLVKSLKN